MPVPAVRIAKRIGRSTMRGMAAAALGGVGWTSRVLAGRRASTLPPVVSRILVIRLDLLGDVVLSMPAVERLHLRYPDAEIDMLVLPFTAPLVSLFPFVRRVWTYDINLLRPSGDMLNIANYARLGRLVRDLKAQRYDIAVSLYGAWASALAFASGAYLGAGYAGEAIPNMCSLLLPGRRYLEQKHEVEYCLALATALGATGDRTNWALAPPPAARVAIRSLLTAEGIGPRDRLVVLHPGATNGAAKRWAPERFAMLADRIRQELGSGVVLTGSSREKALADRVVSLARGRIVSLAGRTSLPELVALIERANAVVSGDSAPLHLAVALGVPSVAIHGPTDPRLSGPFGGSAMVVRHQVSCGPCYNLSEIADCPHGRPVCMDLVTVDEVFAAVDIQIRKAKE